MAATTHDGTQLFGALVTKWLPPALLVVSWLLGWALVGLLLDAGPVLWALLPSALLLVMRLLLEFLLARRVEAGAPVLTLWFWVHAVLLVWAIWLNPFTCIYAFTGYIDRDRILRGPASAVAMVITALCMAFGQAGGPAGVTGAPLLYLGLAMVNLIVAAAMAHLSLARERQVQAREEAVEALTVAHAENAALQSRLVEQARTAGVTEERARLSREIHDTVAQGLVGVIQQLEALPDDLDDTTRTRVIMAETAARECLLEARRAVQALAPYQLSDTTVVDAISALAADWARTHKVVIEFDADEAPTEIDHGPELLRVAQESLANVARHAHASKVSMTLQGTTDQVVFTITDDGVGLDPTKINSGHGLSGMVERLAAVRGRLDVRSTPGHGCTIEALLPAAAVSVAR
ncbi:sensor histidine kinase [Propionibacteriaceae bacterium Y1700]|uniref:sensor histidine kinase n=1 Tax=Microlunatus sp. Y1700 TaxID=3418487 RepID=UPI003DA751EE